MALVLDASATVPWCFADEVSGQTETLLDEVRRNGARVPAIWPLEVANVLLGSERGGRVAEAQTVAFFALLAALPITVEETRTGDALLDVVALARGCGLSAYDASYLQLALQEALPLATLDQRLAEAARRAGVTLLLDSAP